MPPPPTTELAWSATANDRVGLDATAADHRVSLEPTAHDGVGLDAAAANH